MTTNALVKVSPVQSTFLLLRQTKLMHYNFLLYIATDRDIKTKPNEVYGFISGHDREFLVTNFYMRGCILNAHILKQALIIWILLFFLCKNLIFMLWKRMHIIII